MIEITRGLYGSDRKYEEIGIEEVEEYLKKNKNCYERPNRERSRVYIDIDGKIREEMEESEYKILDETITFILKNLEIGEYSLMCSSNYEYKKLSYRITMIKKYGSKKNIKRYVEEEILNKIEEGLNGVIVIKGVRREERIKKIKFKLNFIFRKGKKN